MIALLFAAVRLLGVVAAVIRLPGLIATRRRLLPLRLLHVLTVGVFVHVLALVVTTFIVSRVSQALWLLPLLTFACAFIVRAVRHSDDPAWDPPALRGWSVVVVAMVVALAALLRWFHNFHYDDTAHLLYLTDVLRENTLFPDQFFLQLWEMHDPRVGDGVLLLSRYPYWSVSYTVLAQLARVAPGDAYLLLGLGVLALTMGQMSALVGRAWSPRSGLLWVVTLLAVSLYVNDNLLNYGGYPFQTGKLFVFLAGTSLVVAWVTQRSEYLSGALVGLFVGPLLHTNNVIAAAWIAVLAVAVAISRPALRYAVAMSLLSIRAAGGCSWRSARDTGVHPLVAAGTDSDVRTGRTRTRRVAAVRWTTGDRVVFERRRNADNNCNATNSCNAANCRRCAGIRRTATRQRVEAHRPVLRSWHAVRAGDAARRHPAPASSETSAVTSDRPCACCLRRRRARDTRCQRRRARSRDADVDLQAGIFRDAVGAPGRHAFRSRRQTSGDRSAHRYPRARGRMAERRRAVTGSR
ncbi:MAG: hypothetical protein QM736_23675 [Vicinamibacterales bacterium]